MVRRKRKDPSGLGICFGWNGHRNAVVANVVGWVVAYLGRLWSVTLALWFRASGCRAPGRLGAGAPHRPRACQREPPPASQPYPASVPGSGAPRHLRRVVTLPVRKGGPPEGDPESETAAPRGALSYTRLSWEGL